MEPISYKLIRSDRRSIGIQIMAEGVVVRAPKGLSAAEIDRFVQSKRDWIESHLAKVPTAQAKFSNEEIHRLADEALKRIPERVLPDYRQSLQWLKVHERELIGRL